MGVPIEYNQTRAYNINIRSMKLHDQDIFLFRQNWVMVLVNIYYLFTYLSVFVDDGSRWNLGITALISWSRIAPLRWVVILFFSFFKQDGANIFLFFKIALGVHGTGKQSSHSPPTHLDFCESQVCWAEISFVSVFYHH